MYFYKKIETHGLFLFLAWFCIGIDYQDEALVVPIIELDANQVVYPAIFQLFTMQLGRIRGQVQFVSKFQFN
ncbi:hypothetical protein [Algoriphagus yeomjeoni]|nr:hypothetical protein [Algoriphagus yeomjeoni]